MTIELAKGVNLQVVPTKKYKTLHILIRSVTRLCKKTITKRTLLSSLLETNSLHYPDQVKISEKLAELYGANFGIYTSKKGNHHWLNVSMTIPNGRYLMNDNQIFADSVDFLKEILFFPNIVNQAFEQETFQREKKNLAAYFKSVNEDKQVHAALALQQLYFDQSASQQIPSFGTLEDLEMETAESMAKYYSQLIMNDPIEIFIIGDVTEDQAVSLFKDLPFEDRKTENNDIFYYQSDNNLIKERSEQEVLAQSKLNLGYHTGIYYGSEFYFALQVFNGIFGGFPHSKLFMNVREKENLAYYVSSSIDTFRGYLTIQTGIDRNNREKVLHLIAEELENIRLGKISPLEMEQTKAMLKNQYLSSLDNVQAIFENNYLKKLFTNYLSIDEQIRRMEAVTIEEIQKVASLIQLQAIFFLEGVEEDA
ncbi:pitrilysin family protein [Melissococcus plutonius]|uniref:Zinc protease n=1 Tax=Melissococcus plutonius TaxID=33970 RepID=A0A2Z5Y0D2_9ENTE|nr:pitrilysin family protein [Melissococcus plutonius]BAL61419.1 zinc protease [Melissococcus plutonius DAT561]MCV2498819.1 insulinase family protein [Melissococcus plutonius]MCV2501837.1 insulinase family protein [Melissococcus plutonius]MCV2504903.1 insulinase family protein [Melissococcus plutonius]MCV2507435.1 insulinase family protein [Melissococcus plutonius]